MIVSPFTPLFFISRKTDGIKSDYIQTFAPGDHVLLEVIGNKYDSAAAWIIDGETGERQSAIPFRTWQPNTDDKLWFASLSLSAGMYAVEISGIGVSEVFRVTDNPAELDRTTLIQYSMKDNRQRKDAVFFINGMQYFFDFRVPGGFKDSGWTFGVDNEQFVSPMAEISQLYGIDSVQKRFTMGTAQGVPVWYGELLNRILTCTHVYFDGVKYARKDSSVPEMTESIQGVNSFIFAQNLQLAINLDDRIERENQMVLRRTADGEYRKLNDLQNRAI